MNDPWDVKSARQPGHYVSCMKINGVPLLPPLLSKDCRKEMQYYRLLAKEVEKRITHLKTFVEDSDEDSTQDKTDAPELPHEYEQVDEPLKEVEVEYSSSSLKEEKLHESVLDRTNTHSPDLYDSVSTNSNASNGWSKFSVDINFKQNETDETVICNKGSPQHSPRPTDPPERDYNATPKKNTSNKVDDEILANMQSYPISKHPKVEKKQLFSIEFDIGRIDPILSNPLPDMDGPSSLGSKSFTGSLNNIHSESTKEASSLVRQSSYTVLNPSPLLLAHLKVQSISTGVDVTSISMSESLSNLTTPKKRRSWDLESAKIKWSSMAHELKQRTSSTTKQGDNNRTLARTVAKKPQSRSPPRAKSVQDKPRRASLPGKSFPKSEPTTQKIKKHPSPYANHLNSVSVKEPVNKPSNQNDTPLSANRKLISECEDPATKVKELYEKIQNQQLLQMAHLVEKQKREQMLLQQVFEEQNSILYRQLKTICPKSPVEAKAAWAEVAPQADRGPVSLSQLINNETPEKADLSGTSTLTDTYNNLNKCADILRRSKDITGSIKMRDETQNRKSPDRSATRTHTPTEPRARAASRRLSYDTSGSSEREGQVLTDRTNDTLAGLNVTFPSDSDECPTHVAPPRRPPPARAPHKLPPTPAQLAAASTIVAYARGYLVRRLLRTERVQATVQTIRDALLCALQLHQDRAGIRGADVDLHRRLIQQITAACYSLHDTFVASSPSERCALIAADRERQRQKPAKPVARHYRQKTDVMSQSHSGAFPARAARPAHAPMTQSNYEESEVKGINYTEMTCGERMVQTIKKVPHKMFVIIAAAVSTFNGSKLSPRSYMPSPRRRPWR